MGLLAFTEYVTRFLNTGDKDGMRFLALAMLALSLGVAAMPADAVAASERGRTRVAAQAPQQGPAHRSRAAVSSTTRAATARHARPATGRATEARQAARAGSRAVATRSAERAFTRGRGAAAEPLRRDATVRACPRGARASRCGAAMPRPLAWQAGLEPAAGVQMAACPEGTVGTLARGHTNITRCMPL